MTESMLYLTAISEAVQKPNETTLGFLKSRIIVSGPEKLCEPVKYLKII